MSDHAAMPNSETFWGRIGRLIRQFGEAMDLDETTLLAARVARLERELTELKDQQGDSLPRPATQP